MNIPYPSTDPAQSPSATQPSSAQTQNSRLPAFLWVSIAALVAITVVTIITLFIETIDSRGGRITATFLLFAAFTGLTALDTFRGSARNWYGPAALVSNIWALAASLMVIWLLPAHPYTGVFAQAVGLSILIFFIARAALLLSMLVLHKVEQRTPPERGFGYGATAALVLAAAVYTGYLAVASVFGERLSAHFGYTQMESFWDIWLKIGTAALIIGALCTSITLLLRWFHGAEERAQARAREPQAWQTNPYGNQQQVAIPAQSPVPPVQHAQHVPPVRPGFLPWPVHPDGQPYSAGPDGQPDFEAAKKRDEAMGNSGHWPIG